MAMQKAYSRINWENYPSIETPVNEQNLNKIDKATEEIDNRVISLDTTKFDKTEAQGLFKAVSLDPKTGIITFTTYSGAKKTIDTLLEKIAINFDFDEATQKIIIILEDGTRKEIDVSAFIKPNEFLESETIAWTVDNQNRVTAIVKEGSIEEKHLRPNYLADIKVESAKAEAARDAAQTAESHAKASETAAKKSETNAAASATASAGSAEDSENSANASADSAAAALASQKAAKTSETNAGKSATAAKTSETNAGNSAAAAAESASAAAESEDNAAASETAAATSATNAATSEKNAKTSETNAKSSQTAAANSASAAKNSETNASDSAEAAAASEASALASKTAAASSASAAKTSENAAKTSQTAAANSASAAKTSQTAASESASAAEEWSKWSQSYAVGEGAKRENEQIENAKYYYEQAKRISQGLEGSLLPMGTIKFAQLENSSKAPGYMYNISDAFVSDSNFADGGGHQYGAGSNVYRTVDDKWDVLAAVVVTGVKGNAEGSYRQGNVNITKENVGLGNVPNVTTDNQTPSFTQATTRDNIKTGEKLSVLFGKIAKWFSDLKAVAFSGAYSDLTGTPGDATTSAHGLMTAADKLKLNYTNVAYGTCSTAAATAAKVISVSGNTKWALTAGAIIIVKFTATNTAQNPTFNVNGTGAKSVWYNTALITTGSLNMAGTANRPMIFAYDGTQFIFVGWSTDANTTYTNASLGQGYGTCSTAASTVQKDVTLASYALTVGGIVAVKFTNAVPASATMNINSKGAKPIYYKGAAIVANIIKAGDTATFIYNGTQYHLLSIDNRVPLADTATTATTANKVAHALTFTGKVVSSYDGSADRTIEIPVSLPASGGNADTVDNKHADDFVAVAGDTMTGDLTLSGASRAIKYASGSRTGTPIVMYAGDANGSGLVIGDGGRTIVGGGEAAVNLRNALGTTAANESAEELHLAGDAAVQVHTNCQTIAERKIFTFGGNGTFTTPQLIDSGLTANTAVIANGSKQLASSTTTSTELGYVHGVTGAIQTQLNNKLPLSGGTVTGDTTFNRYLNINAWPNYGTGAAKLWYNGTTKTIDVEGATNIDLKATTAGTADKVTGALTFTGNVTGTWDGSSAQSINITDQKVEQMPAPKISAPIPIVLSYSSFSETKTQYVYKTNKMYINPNPRDSGKETLGNARLDLCEISNSCTIEGVSIGDGTLTGAINELNTKLKFDIYSYNKSTTAGQSITLSDDTYTATDIYAISKITSNNTNGYDNGTAFLNVNGHIAYKPDMTASASNIIVMVIHK